MKNKIFSVVTGICIAVILLLTAAESVVYNMDWFEKEYEKYNVYETVAVLPEDLLPVTEEMMAYLKGNRLDLNIKTTVDGTYREFFNQREKDHMVDVQRMVVYGFRLRMFLIVIGVFCGLKVAASEKKCLPLLTKGYCVGSSIFFIAGAVLFGVASRDFSGYFIRFHEMFFTNDLWMLDPATDLLINIVPEGFFMDTAALIMGRFLGAILLLFALCAAYLIYLRRRKIQ